jgi:replicative DNA helicase
MASIDTRRMKKGGLTDDEYRQCVTTSELVDEYPFHEFNSAGVNIENLCMQIRASKADIIIVDYLGCIPAPVTGNKTHLIGQVTNELRSTAKRTGKVLIALVQLNRESARQATEPDLHDLRDSGELEQDADVVCFLYDPQAAEHYQQGALDIRVELLFKKMRDGEIGRRTLSFSKPFSRFYDLVPDSYHDPRF